MAHAIPARAGLWCWAKISRAFCLVAQTILAGDVALATSRSRMLVDVDQAWRRATGGGTRGGRGVGW